MRLGEHRAGRALLVIEPITTNPTLTTTFMCHLIMKKNELVEAIRKQTIDPIDQLPYLGQTLSSDVVCQFQWIYRVARFALDTDSGRVVDFGRIWCSVAYT